MVLAALEEKAVDNSEQVRPKLYLLPPLAEPATNNDIVPLNIRTMAYFIDILIISLITAISTAIFFLAYKNVQIKLMLTSLADRRPYEINIVRELISGLTFASYMTIYNWYWNGQTIGKKLWGLRVIHENAPDAELSFWRALARTGCYGLSYLSFGLGFALALLRSDQKALHDLLSQTKVIKSK